jgi:hypothetical protein
LRKRLNEEHSDSDPDAWGLGPGSIEEIVNVDHVSCTKTKKIKLNNNSSSPIKTTQLEQDSSSSHSFE